jgi:predicted amidophosphoribosyltransferase
MDARQCKRCKKLFQYAGKPICRKCEKELDEQFAEVRDYIYANPNSNIEEVCEATGVESAVVHGWIIDGRLLLSIDSPIALKCAQCGSPIISGTKCDICLGKLRNTFQAAAESMKPKPAVSAKKPVGKQKERMHVEVRQSDFRKN